VRRRVLLFAALLGGGTLSACSSCARRLEVPEATYRETVTAFHTGLAAMQTSQDIVARKELERVTQLVPGEPAGWANLGLLLMRQQELAAAEPKLARAAELAPKSAAVQRLRALLESRQGRLPEAIGHWRRAAELDPGDLKAPYALALDLERQAGADSVSEARRVLEALLSRTENLAARLELARLAAKGGDAAGLRRAVTPLAEMSQSWPPAAREHLGALQNAGSDPAAATRVAFLKNVLLRTPEFRRALERVSTPRQEVGEPLTAFLALRNPEPQAAPRDASLAFDVEPLPGPSQSGCVTPVWLTGEGLPVVVVAGAEHVLLAGGARAPFPGTTAAPPAPPGLLAADFNYDYRADLLLAGGAGVKLLRQEDGRFADVTHATGLPAAVLGAPAFGAWAADVDTEGDLDAVLAPVDGPPVVLRNNGDGTFAVQQPFPGVSRLRGFAWSDLDGDGVPDAALLDATGTVHVFWNLRGGVFHPAPLPPGVPKLVALAAAEVTGDALFDVLGVAADGAVTRLALGDDRRRFEARTIARGAALPAGTQPGAARLLLADLDNNGAADLVVGGPAASQVLLGGGGHTFEALAAPLGFAARAAADLDGDGRVEILGVEGERAVRAKSRGGKAYHWQALRPRSATATGDQRINSFGIGGEIELRTGLHLQKRTIEAPVVHFGLGEATRAEVARMTWPNGIIQSEFGTAADTTVAASQRLKGSCPWLFGWNGREMAFVTDLIWRSPLGLRINAQQTADVLMTEDWVKVGGDQLVPRDGAYDLRVTAELWETHFFDLLSLLVVDHPEGTEVFVDERFAMPAPKLAIHVTGPVRELKAARDDRGGDVSELVRRRDGRHLDFAGRGAYQGITRDHYVELELPEDAPWGGPLWLVGQGWVHPTDSSVNVAISQGAHAGPRGLSLLVADAAGRFRTVKGGLGFPSGKDKTVLLDLTGVFPARGPRRLRLATNLEVFWDRLGWAEGRPEVRPAPLKIALASAELDYRGYSVTEQDAPGSPERPRYLLAGTAPRWLDLEGYHTRFGDVRELLAAVDDRYVIMNAGDEMRLRFPQAPAPAPGLVRDFVLVGDGWVKDGDFNTTFSRTVLPLPTHRSGRYDRAPRELEEDPLHGPHRTDFETYHTRYVSPDAVRGALAGSGAR
jgi:cytochrome c-type biogenesis protein CcmH/NrfG